MPKLIKSDEIERIKKVVLPILKKNGVTKAGIFGSYARGEQKKESDIDILIKLSDEASLLDFVGLKIDLEKALHRKTDLVEYNAIKPLIRKGVLEEEVGIL